MFTCKNPLPVTALLALLSGASLSSHPSEEEGLSDPTVTPLLASLSRLHGASALFSSSKSDEEIFPPPNNPHAQNTNVRLCDYNPCAEKQRPCAQLAASSGCLCPGVSGPFVLPEAPELKGFSTNGSAVVVQWCAPLSVVTHYQVVVGRQEPLVFDEWHRSGAVGRLQPGEKVCVESVNSAGVSSPQRNSCLIYEGQEVGSSVALKAGLIGGALGLLLLLSIAVLLWRLRARRKSGASTSTRDTEDL